MLLRLLSSPDRRQGPDAGLQAVPGASARTCRYAGSMLTTGHRSAVERVAGFLLAFSRRNERNGKDRTMFELPMTRTDIGDFLGLTIETVSSRTTNRKV